MTKEEIAVLGHAFFDGKTLQYLTEMGWITNTSSNCPDLNTGLQWRIKPDEPKRITICTFVHVEGDVTTVVKDSYVWMSLLDIHKGWTHIKSLDQVAEVE